MKAAIIADDWKVALFEQELTAAGFTYEKAPFINGNTTLRVWLEPKQLGKLSALCARVQVTAWHQKEKEN